MDNFMFHNPTKIYFGSNSMEALAEELSKVGKKILLVIGGGSVKVSGLYDEVTKVLRMQGKETYLLEGIKGNPELNRVYEGIEICRKNDVDLVLAVGGGSVIDTSKAICGGVCYGGDVWDCFIQEGEIVESLPLGVILTVAATGSEMNGNAVITNEATNEKRGIFSIGGLEPLFSILNPLYTLTLPKGHTMSGVADILAHLMESYFCKSKNVVIQNTMLEGLCKVVIECGYLLNKDLENYEARESLMWASTLALNGFLHSGKAGDWSCHALEHAVSGYYDIPHGEGLSILFPAWMEVVYKEDENLFKRFFREVFSIPDGNIVAGIEALRSYFKNLGLRGTFTEMDVPKESIPKLVAHSFKFGAIGNIKELSIEDGTLIYEKCF